MASALHRVRQNFAYQIEQVDPTCKTIGRGFKCVDRLLLDPSGNNTGRARDFTVAWHRADKDDEPTDGYRRTAWHEFEVRISYPTAIGPEGELADMIAQDRHDLIERLRTRDYFIGFAGQASGATGLMNRHRENDQLDDGGDVWVHAFLFRCLVREDI